MEVNISFYDVGLAEHRLAYGNYCQKRLIETMECHERFGAFGNDSKIEASRVNIPTGYRIYEEWSHFGEEKEAISKELPSLTLLENLYQAYCRCYEAQQSVGVDGQHFRIIGEGLSRMPMERSINLSDKDKSREEWETCYTCVSDEAISQWCLRRMSWKDAVGVPPVKTFPELLKTLSLHEIFPTNFEVEVTAPNDMSLLQLPVDNQNHIRHALSQSQHLLCHFTRCARQDSLAYEILQLSSLTMAYFSATNLQSLELSFDDYPSFNEFPNASFLDLLPSKAWPNLKTVSLRHLCCHESDLESFVDRQRMTVRRLTLCEIRLISGEWINCLEYLRRFSMLEHVEMSWPTGGEFGDNSMRLRSYFKNEALASYVLHGGKNPLEGIV